MTYRPSDSLKLSHVLEYLSSNSQVPSSQGSQLERVRDGTTGGGGYASPDVEQGIIDRANLARCVDELEKQQSVRWSCTDVLNKYALRNRMRPGAVAVGVMRAYQPWAADIDLNRPAGSDPIGADRGPSRALAEVYQWMAKKDRTLRIPDISEPSLAQAFKAHHAVSEHLAAGKMYADAANVICDWVEMWNAKAGFKKFLSVAEFVDRYQIPVRTVQDWCEKGKLSAVLLDGQYRIDVSEVDYSPDTSSSILDIDEEGLSVTS